MTRVYVVVEGQTEETFIKEILAPALWPREVYLMPRILGRPGQKGGNTNYPRVKTDIALLLKQEATAYCSTMLDFYGLGSGFPETPLPENLTNLAKVAHIERAMKQDITATVPAVRPDIRFLPYIQLHEYEGLFFSDPEAFANGIGMPALVPQFETVRRQFPTPEDINDGFNTAASKRILQLHPQYRKPLDGTRAAKAVGIETMRRECPHFRDWVERLEALPTGN